MPWWGAAAGWHVGAHLWVQWLGATPGAPWVAWVWCHGEVPFVGWLGAMVGCWLLVPGVVPWYRALLLFDL